MPLSSTDNTSIWRWPPTWLALRIAFVQLCVIAVGVGFGTWRALSAPHRSTDSFVPNLDAMTLAWFGFALVGILFPRLSKFKAGSVEIELQEVVEDLDSTLEDATELLENWARATTLFAEQLEGELPIPITALVSNFMRDRCSEATEWLTSDDEPRRISVWIWDDELNKLVFYYSNDIDDETTTLKQWDLGEGCIGQAFLDGAVWNESDATKLPAYVKVRSEKPMYKGLLLIPMYFKQQKVGMLSIDRRDAKYFDAKSIAVAKALAHLIAYASFNQRTLSLLEENGEATSDEAP